MERQLERPLTSDEHRWLALYAAATPDEEQGHGATRWGDDHGNKMRG